MLLFSRYEGKALAFHHFVVEFIGNAKQDIEEEHSTDSDEASGVDHTVSARSWFSG